jgi:hypothetical protein
MINLQLLTLILGTCAAISGLIRILLVMSGIYKEPVLGGFQKYGDDEQILQPLPSLLFCMGAAMIATHYWLDRLTRLETPFLSSGIVLIAVAWIVYRLIQRARPAPQLILGSPRWLVDLYERSSRLERRRIAYMWMRLSWRARLAYDSSDKAFLEWADMIIVSTLM